METQGKAAVTLTIRRPMASSSSSSAKPPSRTDRVYRSGTGSGSSSSHSSSMAEELAKARAELLTAREELHQVRLQWLAEQQCSGAAVTQQLLEKLSTQDIAAHRTATEVRYTAMALSSSMDCLEIELRRLLRIGLTSEAVDIAAVEAGARRFIRSNIGYRVQSVSEVPPVAIELKESEMSTAPDG